MKKFTIQLDELLTSMKDRLEEVSQDRGTCNADYYNEKMLENKNDSFCVDGHMVRFINENVIIAEDEQQYNHEAMEVSDYCELIDELFEMHK